MPSLRRQSYKAMLRLFPAPIRISPSSLVSTEASSDPCVNQTSITHSHNPAPTANSRPLHHLHHERSAACLDKPPPCLRGIESSIARADADDQRISTSADSCSSALGYDAGKALDIFLRKMPHLNDVQDRVRILDALCTTFSVAKPIVIDECVAVGCVEAILNLLSESDCPQRTAPMVKQTEKALLLLDLITAESEAGCAAALERSSLIISTLGRKLLRISEACTASAMAILITLCSQSSDGGSFCRAASTTAISSKLVVVLQVASKDSIKQSAAKLLQLLQLARRD